MNVMRNEIKEFEILMQGMMSCQLSWKVGMGLAAAIPGKLKCFYSWLKL